MAYYQESLDLYVQFMSTYLGAHKNFLGKNEQ